MLLGGCLKWHKTLSYENETMIYNDSIKIQIEFNSFFEKKINLNFFNNFHYKLLRKPYNKLNL